MQLTKQGAQILMVEYYKARLRVTDEMADMLVHIQIKADTDGLVSFAFEKGREAAVLDNLLKGVDVENDRESGTR